jgi:hypothetical protein
MMNCPYCKVEVVDNRCPKCGVKVTKGEPSKYKGEVMIDYDELQSIQSELEIEKLETNVWGTAMVTVVLDKDGDVINVQKYAGMDCELVVIPVGEFTALCEHWLTEYANCEVETRQPEIKEEDVSVIWQGSSFEIIPFDDDCIAFRDEFKERDYFIWWNKNEALEIADAIRDYYDVVKRQPEIAKCPNPECVMSPQKLLCYAYVDGYGEHNYHVACSGCGYIAPHAKTESEAIRLHNQIAGR